MTLGSVKELEMKGRGTNNITPRRLSTWQRKKGGFLCLMYQNVLPVVAPGPPSLSLRELEELQLLKITGSSKKRKKIWIT